MRRLAVVPRKPKLIAAFAVLGVGVCLAWPWRRDRPTNVVPSAAPATVAPNAPVAPAKDLMATAPSEITPAPLANSVAPPEQNPFAAVSSQLQSHTAAKPPIADGVTPLPFALAPLPGMEATSARQTHIVHAGDSLESLAKRYLGDEARALELFDLNREVLENPHLLPIGAELAIPANPEAPATALAH